jgi:hypothetical protein
MGIWTDRSARISAGGTSQVLAAANIERIRIYVLNPASSFESIFLNFTDPASTSAIGSLELTPGSYYDSDGGPVTFEALNITAPTTGHAFVAKEMQS